MLRISTRPLPESALLQVYRRQDAYTDCFATEIAGIVTHEQFVAAFYSTALFKLERLILKLALGKSSTDAQVQELANGSDKPFAAWTVEARAQDQLLLCDFQQSTRSWLMVEAMSTTTEAETAMTRLYFGSAVVPKARPSSGKPAMGAAFRLLLGFHKLYSIALLFSARTRLSIGLRVDE